LDPLIEPGLAVQRNGAASNTRPQAMKIIILVFAGLLIISSCDSSNKTGKTPEQIQAEIEAGQKRSLTN